MSLEQCTSLLDTVEDCLPTSFSATDQLSLLNGIDMPAKSYANEQQTDGFLACTCGKGMSDCLTHPSTPEKWTAFMRDSLVRILASLESRQAYLREPDQVFTAKSCALLAWYDQSSSSWKTYQQSFLTDSEPFSETWPRWGMTVGGSAYAHPMSVRRITETDGFYLPTILKSTPTKWNVRKDGYRNNIAELPTLEEFRHLNGKYINLQWVEWMFMFPIGYTELKALETVKYRCKLQPPTDC